MDLDITIIIDRDLDIKVTKQVRQGQPVRSLRALLAADDPTGQSSAESIVLARARPEGEAGNTPLRPLQDYEPLTADLGILEICSPEDQATIQDSDALLKVGDDVEIHDRYSRWGGPMGTIVECIDDRKRFRVWRWTCTEGLVIHELELDALKRACEEDLDEVIVKSASIFQTSALQFPIDSLVQVSGLESESGKMLNGQKGVVATYLEDVGRYEVILPNKRAKLKPENLSATSIQCFDRVLVCGLESEGGRQMNGQTATVVRLIEDTGRFEVRLSSGKLVGLKLDNLKRLDGNGVSIDEDQFMSMLKEMRDAYKADKKLQALLSSIEPSLEWSASFTAAMREVQRPIFKRYNYPEGMKGGTLIKDDLRRCVLGGNALAAKIDRELSYFMHISPKGEKADGLVGDDLAMEWRSRLQAMSWNRAWREMAHQWAHKGWSAFVEDVLHEEAGKAFKQYEAPLKQCASSLMRKQFHSEFAKLVQGDPSHLGTPPSQWKDAWAHNVCSADQVASLLEKKYLVLDGTLDAALVAAAHGEMQQLHQHTRLHSCTTAISHGAKFTNLRFGDEEMSAHLKGSLPALFETSKLLCGLPEALAAQDVTKTLAALRVETATKVQVHEPGVVHRPHLDWYGDEGGNYRMVTCIVYLNPPDFLEKDGGALRLYNSYEPAEDSILRQSPPEPNSTPHMDFAPLAGRIVIFLSRGLWHETLPATRDRYAMTLWVPAPL
mmetsp:Transcript_120547/g.218987  ORF Transcript_120547/g.218987 Transcript_120547/m.218987 type:complete len:722 (-) Transcript_120547:58-2223(-)